MCDELNISDAIDALDSIETLKNVIVIGKPESEVKSCIPIGDLLEDDGKNSPKRLDTDWEKQTVYLPFTSTSSGSKVKLLNNNSIKKTLIFVLFRESNILTNLWYLVFSHQMALLIIGLTK